MIFRGGERRREDVYDQIKELRQNDWIKQSNPGKHSSFLIQNQQKTSSNTIKSHNNPKNLLSKEGDRLKHTSEQLMQHLLKGINCQQSKACLLSTSEQEEQLGELLTNRYKLQQYKLQLSNQIIKGHSTSTPYCKALLLLLNQMGRAELEIKYADKGLQIGFNERKIRKQQEEIDRLQNQNDKKRRELNDLSKQYQKIVYQFNEVIQKLVGNNMNRQL